MTLLRRSICTVLFLTLALISSNAIGADKADPLANWQPDFDPSKAEFTYLLSCVGHLYVDFRPLSQLGGEKDVISKLKLGAVHGMMSSSVAAANVSDTLGIVNLPYVVDTFDKLDKFRAAPKLWQPFSDAAKKNNIMVADVTGYGSYGWATNSPVKNLADAKKINFRIAQAPVNLDFYKAWDLKFTVMPWPDVPQALQTGVITGLDHTPIVCNISGKFNVAKNYTQLDYAQGLYIHLINTRWLNKLPKDLQKVLLDVIAEESASARALTQQQQQQQIAAAKESGVNFFTLPEAEKAALISKAQPMYQKWGKKIGADYLQQVQETLQ
ncbi:MAG: TRAP transporter substrate-binding protein [Desulfuromonadales bacterium]|nr:TRAP transporter substrate-binding protein [Desulfuromonadales bacterium]